jgi:hypothetical protein
MQKGNEPDRRFLKQSEMPEKTPDVHGLTPAACAPQRRCLKKLPLTLGLPAL